MSYFPFFLPLSCKHTPWVLDQSRKHKVSPYNLSVKAIIIRSFKLSHRGNMRSAFIRQMEHGCSWLQWALGYDTGLTLHEWSIEMAWIWVKILSYGCRVKMRMEGATPDRWRRWKMEMPSRVHRDGCRSMTKKRISSLRFPHGDLFRMSCCQECTLCPESRVVACG